MKTLFRNALLRSFAPGRPLAEHADILVAGNTIDCIEPAHALQHDCETQVIDATRR
jgi:hypothetical protein